MTSLIWILGLTALVTKLIVDHDWRRERAHALSMAGRGTYR
jgi:hypothetical protein